MTELEKAFKYKAHVHGVRILDSPVITSEYPFKLNGYLVINMSLEG